jgi:hypothetical protein
MEPGITHTAPQNLALPPMQSEKHWTTIRESEKHEQHHLENFCFVIDARLK